VPGGLGPPVGAHDAARRESASLRTVSSSRSPPGSPYLLVGPDYDGPLPEGGCSVRHARTNHVTLIGRAFINENPGDDPAPTVNRIKEQLKIYPYAAGGVGSSVGAYLAAGGRLGQPASPQSPRFVEGTGLAMNTVPPNDFGHYEMLDALVQLEPAEALDTELAGQFAAIGIVKGEKFAPDARRRKILDDAVAVGNAASRIVGMGAHPTEDFRYYEGGSAWWNMLFVGGFEFTNPPPNITAEGVLIRSARIAMAHRNSGDARLDPPMRCRLLGSARLRRNRR
jgi:hypothetical protein